MCDVKRAQHGATCELLLQTSGGDESGRGTVHGVTLVRVGGNACGPGLPFVCGTNLAYPSSWQAPRFERFRAIWTPISRTRFNLNPWNVIESA